MLGIDVTLRFVASFARLHLMLIDSVLTNANHGCKEVKSYLMPGAVFVAEDELES